MVDTVTTKLIRDGKRTKVYHFTNESDATGETEVTKIDISTLTDAVGNAATFSAIDRIDYDIGGFNYVEMQWNHTAPDTIAVLRGRGTVDWKLDGGGNDPRTAGGTGDIQFTTNGAAAGASYDITMWVRPKA